MEKQAVILQFRDGEKKTVAGHAGRGVLIPFSRCSHSLQVLMEEMYYSGGNGYVTNVEMDGFCISQLQTELVLLDAVYPEKGLSRYYRFRKEGFSWQIKLCQRFLSAFDMPCRERMVL